MLTSRMLDVGILQVRCRISTSRMSDVGCRILISQKTDFYKSNVGFVKSDVGWHLQASVLMRSNAL